MAAAASPALVIFADDHSLKWLRPLTPGFRHCFVAVRREGCWVVCNPLSHLTDVDVVAALPVATLAAWYRERGFIVVETEVVRPPPRLAPVRPFTCVEAVKRILGLRAPWVFTPRQLHRYLIARPRPGASPEAAAAAAAGTRLPTAARSGSANLRH